MNKLLILILTLFISNYAFAQISTDRPDQTESSLVLPKGTIQIESGFESNKNEYIFPNTLFRVGVFGNIYSFLLLSNPLSICIVPLGRTKEDSV
jgi:hypothetical protein